MPMPFLSPAASLTRNRQWSPAGVSPSWRVPRRRAGPPGMARTGWRTLSASFPVPRGRGEALAREVMLGTVLGMTAGWAAANLAIWLL